MRLENIVWDARDPHRLGRFWSAALGAEPITDEPDLVEARLHLTGEVFLDLCFPRVAAPTAPPARLGLGLAGGPDETRRLLDLGAAEHHRAGWLTDPEGNPFRVLTAREGHPLVALYLDSADPTRDAAFWSALTGWVPEDDTTLRHPARVGPRLQLCRESEPKRRKSRLHLDVRREAGDDRVADRVVARGGAPSGDPTEHPWLVFTDPSGNEFCVLAAATGPDRPG